MSDKAAGVLLVASVDIVFEVFCHHQHFCELDYFQPNMVSYGMSALDSHKLLMWIKHFYSRFRAEKATVDVADKTA